MVQSDAEAIVSEAVDEFFPKCTGKTKARFTEVLLSELCSAGAIELERDGEEPLGDTWDLP